MVTRTIQNTEEKKDDLVINHSFGMPENIVKDINEKGFHLYNWIGEKDVKQSIERDFLASIKKLGPVLSVILVLPAVIIGLGSVGLGIVYFLGGLVVVNGLLLIYLGILASIRSNVLRKNGYVLITDSSISVNGKIEKIKDFNPNDPEIQKISNTFEEQIFKESNIEKTKKGFITQVFEQIGNGYKTIFKLGDHGNKNSFQIILLAVVLYSIYAISLGLIYFIGIFFIWIFGNILTIINKKILLASGHKITKINSQFENIDEKSKNLLVEKQSLSNFLEQAKQNDWKDSLLTNINTGISKINDEASSAVDTSIDLKKEIQQSKYSEMFNFGIYNSWIKKQIVIPLEQIVDLLNQNLEILIKQKNEIEQQIKQTTDPSYSGPLVASKTRIEMRIEEIEKHIKGMGIYIEKLM